MKKIVFVKRQTRRCRDCFCRYYLDLNNGAFEHYHYQFEREGICGCSRCIYEIPQKRNSGPRIPYQIHL